MNESTCKGCGKKILWVEMASGKKMPLDLPSKPMVQIKDEIGEVIQVFMPHWATCQKASQFKKEVKL